eukprot:CAMPEP_0172492214 /NCGR_PEP_ID=MMETSP1066-20121228/23270_1 /TAXON_ID=671091 /ORGANISM="Coscinodiscus wailesii, Strain CCMP2513" /LENGTH=242 /DNA_ID=CAMNT_0013261695 /DNA_START=230 /DNA_END=955 /DNA_ORIENTATION=-
MKEKNQSSRKQQPTKTRFGAQLTNSTLGDTKKFTKRDLAEACRKVHPANDATSYSNNKRRIPSSSSHPHQAPSQGGGSGTTTTTTNTSSSHTQDLNDKDVSNQLKVLDAGVKLCARKYNECKARGDDLERSLRLQRDIRSELTREATALDDMIDFKNPEAKSITTLTSDVSRAIAAAEETLEYRLTLQHVLGRLRKNSIALDAHVGAMADTIACAAREKETCERMLGEVDSAHTAAVRELEA